MYKQNKGFTLVELIVVITILAILGSIAFVSLQGYGKSARDSARISEVGQFKAGLEIFAAQSGYYMPAGNAEILDDSNTGALSFVGTTGEDLARITNLSEAISDPVTGVEYTYAVAGNKKQYEVYYELEAEDAGIINSASAFDATKKVVTGNYNGVFTIAEKGQVVAMPSLVTTTGTITLGSDSVDFKMSEKDADVSFTPVKVADTVPTKIAAQKTMVEAIQTAYSGNESLSENIKEVTSLDTTNTSEIESFVIGGLGSDKVDNTADKISCVENTSYSYNGHTYTIPDMYEGDEVTVTSSNVSESNGDFTYDLTLTCSGGSYTSESESTANLTNCDSGYTINPSNSAECLVTTVTATVESGGLRADRHGGGILFVQCPTGYYVKYAEGDYTTTSTHQGNYIEMHNIDLWNSSATRVAQHIGSYNYPNTNRYNLRSGHGFLNNWKVFATVNNSDKTAEYISYDVGSYGNNNWSNGWNVNIPGKTPANTAFSDIGNGFNKATYTSYSTSPYFSTVNKVRLDVTCEVK